MAERVESGSMTLHRGDTDLVREIMKRERALARLEAWLIVGGGVAVMVGNKEREADGAGRWMMAQAREMERDVGRLKRGM